MNTEKKEDTLVRNYKDSVFRMLFNEKKNLIELYNALFDADYDEDTPLEFETIEEVLFKTIKNDIPPPRTAWKNSCRRSFPGRNGRTRIICSSGTAAASATRAARNVTAAR